MKPSRADLKGLSDPTSPDACDVAGRFLPDRSELCRAGWESKLFNAAADPDESQTATEHALEVPGFEIISQLGSGSSGEVWLADELEPGRIVALKIMHRHGGASAPPEILQREFQILGKLMHPNLVVLYHAILTKDGRHGLAMEWIDGWPLDEWLALHPDLSLEDKLELFRGMVRGVAFLHDNGVIHRDLKPANVIVDTNGTPKIVDFGLARLHYEGLATTLDGCSMGIAGTLHFMAPEQAADSSGSRAMPVDVYALGLMFHRILTGRWLRPADATPAETLALALNPPPLKWSGPDLQLPHDLRSIVRQSLETDPARRYRHARDLEADLQRFTSKLPVAAREHTAFYLATTFLRRQGRRSVVAGLLMVAGLAAGSVLYFRHRAVAERNEANLKHAYALTSFTLLQLRDELSTTTEDDPFGTSAGDFLPGPASESDPPLPINASGELDLRYYQALLADIRSVNSEAHSRYATALKSIRKALDLYSKLALESRDDPKRLLDAARARLAFARLLEQVGQMDGAGSHANKTLLQLDRLAGWQGADKTQLLTMRCDALGLLAKQAHQDGNSAEAVEVALEILTAYTEWLNKSGAPPGNGSIARLTKAASDLATYALAAGPVPLPDVRLKIDTATRICRAAHEREPGSFPLACCLARILYATARISLQTGADTEAASLLQEVAKLLIDTPSISKSSSLPLVWEISRIATDRAETLLDHPDPLVSSAALSLAQDFTTHLRRSGDGRDEVLIQRARIYLYQSRLNCRIQNRQSGCRPISIALEMLRPRQARDPENIPLSLLTAAALHQARSLSDFPEARWNEKQALYLASLIKQLSERKSELTPKLQQELESFK